MHATRLKVSLPAYLAMEAAEVELKHEYWEGDCWAMAGTRPEHHDLVFAFESHLRDHLRGSDCRVYAESIRTRISEKKYVYPDIVVACPPRFDSSPQPPTLTNPKLIVEVLSSSTASFDRGDKLRAYQALPTIEEVVLADARAKDIQHHRRQADGTWLLRNLGAGDTLVLGLADARIAVDALYAEVDLSRAEE